MSGQGKRDRLQQKSPAEFFADNKNIAGFDNVRSIRLLTRFRSWLQFEIDRFVVSTVANCCRVSLLLVCISVTKMSLSLCT